MKDKTIFNQVIVYIDNAASDLQASGNVYGSGFVQLYYLPNINSLTSDGNCFDDGTENSNIEGVSYATVAAYQAGTGQDAGSTIGGCKA